MDLTCSICLTEINDFKDKKTLACEHMFHKDCYKNYSINQISQLKNTKCPNCNYHKTTNIILNKNFYNILPFEKIEIKNNNIIDKLNKFFTISEMLKFLSYLNDNVCISGSFILSTILDEDYTNNDIDIYIDNQTEYIKMLKFLIRTNYKLIDDKNFLFKYNNKNLIIFVDTFIKKNNENIKIDIIYCKNNKELIKNYFDLDIVKNFYNGYDFYVYNKDKLINKFDYISYNEITEKIKNRIIKYQNRGFNITINN